MAFIGFGKIDKNIIPLILGCVFCLLNRLLNSYNGTKLFQNVVLTNIFISLGDIFIIIPYIIYRIKAKKYKKELEIEILRNKSEYAKSVKVRGKAKFIILIGLIFFANYYMFIYTIDIKSNTWIMYIAFTSLFYYLIFKSKLYLHHYLSICLILIFGIVIDLVIGNLQKDVTENLLKIVLSIVRVILLSLDYTLIKYTMEKKYVSPYVLGMFNGLINFVLFLIIAIFDHFIFNYYKCLEYFDNFNTTEFLVILGLMGTQLGLYTTLFFIDKNDSPCHIFIVFVFGQFGLYFYNYTLDKYSAIIILSLILIFFFSLVFNEIIELRFCGLAHNTKRNIIKRAEHEVGDSLIINTDKENERTESFTELAGYSFEIE